jgi:hypothetical protein
LCSVFNTNITKSQWYFHIHNHTLRTSATIHNVDFCNDTYGTDTFRIKLLCHLKSIRDCHISVRWNNCKDDSPRVWHISSTHVLCNLFNICWLCANSNTCDTW